MKSKSVTKAGYWGHTRASDVIKDFTPGATRHSQLVFPQPVAIGPYNFYVRYLSAEKSEQDEQWGHCDFGTQTIWLAETLSGIHFAVILLHELFHACHYVMGLDDSSSEESFTHGQANALVSLMRLNGEVWDWLNAYIRETQRSQVLEAADAAKDGVRRARLPQMKTA